MGGIGGLLGFGQGTSGTQYQAPSGSAIVNPTTPNQIANAYTGSENSLQAQQALLAALQGQNGLQNQSNIYNQLQGVVSGTGANPAQAQLAQATGANVANQAALMAGQRGASSNVGLIARQAAQQGTAAQQAAAGQAATLQANQSLNAINSAGALANTQASNQIGQTNTNASAQQAEQQALLNAQSAYNQAQVGSQASVNAGNAALTNTQLQGQQSLISGALGTIGLGGFLASGAKGGEVKKMAEGGDASVFQGTSGPQSKFGQFLVNMQQPGSINIPLAQLTAPVDMKKGKKNPSSNIPYNNNGGISIPMTPNPTVGTSGAADGANLAGGPMDAIGNIGGATAGDSAMSILDDVGETAVEAAAAGGMIGDYRSGGNVNVKNKAQKAVKNGNSYANDKVPALLSEGEVVIPRSVMQSKDPVNNSAKFVQSILAKRGMRK